MLKIESLEEKGIYFWPTLRTDEVLIVAAEQVSVPGVIEPSPKQTVKGAVATYKRGCFAPGVNWSLEELNGVHKTLASNGD